MDKMLAIAVLAFLNRSRGTIQLTDAEFDEARKMIEEGDRVLLTTQTTFGTDARTSYRIDVVREGL